MLPVYCERLTDGILAEPINAVTNLGFFISFLLIVRRKSFASEKNDRVLLGMAIAALLTGIGSTLWHTLRSPVTLLLDALPLYTYLLLMIYTLCRALVMRSRALLLLLGVVALEIAVAMTVPFEVLNGSVPHVVAVIVIGALVAAIKAKWNRPLPTAVLYGIAAYALAIVFRSQDLEVCSGFLLGTHFLWHIFSSTGSYLGYVSAVRFRAST